MKKAMLLAWGICLFGSITFARNYYVATDGDDANPGTIDKPFATLEKARDAVRQDKSEGAAVVIRGGDYFRAESFTLTAHDSGRPGKPIVYRGYPGETVRLIGGRRLATGDFSEISSEDAVWDRLDPSARGRCVRVSGLKATPKTPLQMELSFGGKLMPLARWPNEGFVRTTSADDDITFGYDDPRPERWLAASDAHAIGYWCHGWSNQIVKIAKIDTTARTITADKVPPYGMQAKKPYYVVNLLEEIDRPGEWYLDRATGSLYFWPPKDLDKSDILISTLEASIIAMKNASHVRIEGLTIEMGVRNGIEVSGGSNVRIERCTLRNMRGNGIDISGTNHGVVQCTIYGIGQTGVGISGGDRATLMPGNNFVRHCTIHDFGRWQRTYAPAIRINGVGNIAANNKLYDAPHSAILFNGNEHRIELNEIYGVCYEVDDAGSVYAGRDWGLRGNVIENNFFHDIESHLTGSNGVHAVYLDDCASGVTVANNVFYRISGRAIMCGGGRDNTIDNNVIARCGSAHFTDRRGKAWMDKDNSWKLLDKIKRVNYTQPPWSERYPRLAHILDNGLEMAKEPEGCIIARNIGWKNERWLEKNCLGACGGFDFYTFQDNIEDQDPKFVDEANLNLALRDDSPAYLIPGFKQIPFETIGPQESDSKLGGYAINPVWMAEAMKVFNAPKPKLELPTKHPDAQWFPEASFGLFLHWGIHSVDGIDPSWSMMKGCPWHGSSDPYKKYNQDQSQYYGLAGKFNPTLYDPDKWMAAAKKAGFTYAVLTTKHHDGYALWPTSFGDFSTKRYMGGRDLLKPYVDACRKHGLKVGFYFSPRDWHYPGYPQAMEYGAKFPLPPAEENFENFKAFYAYTLGQLHELLTRYGRIDLLWFDGMGWSGVGDMRAEQTLAWVRSIQPGIVINPRWSGFGDFATTECTPGKPENWKPGQWWEACDIWPSGHWGYVPSERFKPLSWVLSRLANCRAWGGNFLCNVGPRPDGTMPDVFYDYCDDLSQWMAHSRDSVIGAGLAPGEDRSNVPITTRGDTWYLHVLPSHQGPVVLSEVPEPEVVLLMRTGRTLSYERQGDGLTIAIDADLRSDLDDVVVVRWAPGS